MRAAVPFERALGCLLGCAVGDALGLPMENLSPAVIARRSGALDRLHLLFRAGVVSDDTEQTALLAQALAETDDDDDVLRRFRRHLRFWFARLPFGVGFATLRACLWLWVGRVRSGVNSAGNGAAMRAAILGVVVGERDRRLALGRRLAEVTHTHPLAVEAALYVAELAACCARAPAQTPRRELVTRALEVVTEASLRAAVTTGLETPAQPEVAAARLGSTGYALHSVGLCTWAFVNGAAVHDTLRHAIRAGGDTDTHAAIAGAWAGALCGAAAVPRELLDGLVGGPFGARHLEGLARALTEGAPLPRWSALAALGRNLALYPVVLAHGLRRLVPFG